MKKNRLVRIGIAGLMGLIALAGCNLIKEEKEDYDPAMNQNEDVYGPPPEDEDFDPIDNEPSCVYGPPPEN